MAKIRRDCYGLYVRTDGSVFRPYETPWSCYGHGTANHGITQFGEGEEVTARHMRGTPRARVRGEDTPTWQDRVEIWHSHGCYYDSQGGMLKSEACWTPRDGMNA